MLLMIDNYDSFTYNLVQYFAELGEDVRTYRNDEITLDEIAALKPDHICISPGHARRMKLVFLFLSSNVLPARFRFSASVLVIKVSVRHLAAISSVPSKSCMARRR
jgi:ABC-type Fe3+-hydroxamate transport system substrate-binding protein